MTDDIPPDLKYRIIWSDLSDDEAGLEYGVQGEDVRKWRRDYGRYEDLLQGIQEKLEHDRLDSIERAYWLDIAQGLRFFLGLWFGRPIGGDRISDDAYDDLWRSRAEFMAGAYGRDSRGMLRWCVEVGRTFREGTLGPGKGTSDRNGETI
jgi:hypothetical protein